MKVVIHVQESLPHHLEWGQIFADGLKRHGISSQIVKGFKPADCDLEVFWGFSELKDTIRHQQISRGLHYLVMERGFFGPDKHKWTSLGYDGFNGTADFCNSNSPPDRWELHKHLMKPWNPGKDYILLIGQMQSDAANRHVNLQQWYVDSVMEARAIQNLPVVIRHHPDCRNPITPCGIDVVDGDLWDNLRKAACVITFSSYAGQDALLYGIPVVATDSFSMVYSVVSHNVSQITNQIEPERQQWAYDLAYTQWTEQEIRSGAAWTHLRQKYAGWTPKS